MPDLRFFLAPHAQRIVFAAQDTPEAVSPGEMAEAIVAECNAVGAASLSRRGRVAQSPEEAGARAAVARACLLTVLELLVMRWLDALLNFGAQPQRPWQTSEFVWRTAAELMHAAGLSSPLPPLCAAAACRCGSPVCNEGCRGVRLAMPRICAHRLRALAEAEARVAERLAANRRPADRDEAPGQKRRTL